MQAMWKSAHALPVAADHLLQQHEDIVDARSDPFRRRGRLAFRPDVVDMLDERRAEPQAHLSESANTLKCRPACNGRKLVKIQTSAVSALSRLKHGFESRRERQLDQSLRRTEDLRPPMRGHSGDTFAQRHTASQLAQQQSLLSRPFDAVDRCAARIDAGRAEVVCGGGGGGRGGGSGLGSGWQPQAPKHPHYSGAMPVTATGGRNSSSVQFIRQLMLGNEASRHKRPNGRHREALGKHTAPFGVVFEVA
jgi:hypothetical protein